FWIFIIINIAFWTSLIIRLFVKEEWVFYSLIIALVLWTVACISFGKKWYDISGDNRAVITAGETDVLSGPESGDTVLFKLHEGAEVYFEREESGWFLISLPDNKRGWVEKKDAALISTD
ncbi:MAG: SH3 domain-containing protein, partial [Spirochaetes bacterium]|nr:SH3 domain-containing protein [Spirochaetota bacterium]